MQVIAFMAHISLDSLQIRLIQAFYPHILWGRIMRTRAVVAGGLLALAGVWAISAVGQSMLIVPAEYPPASFEGREYVDSNGCVFIRAGVDGAVTWVPRVTRDRKPVCGFEPTFTAQQLAALNAAEAETMAAAVTPAPMPTPTPTPAPTASTTTMASSPNVVNDIFVGGSNMVSGTTYSATSSGSDPAIGYSVPSEVPGQVVNDIYVGNGGYASTTTATPTYSAGGGSSNYVQTYANNSSSLAIGIPNSRGGIPAGYKPAWDDGRVNPHRGPQSSAGDASMNQVWTQSIPRQLIADVGGYQRVRGGLGNSVRSVIPWMSSKEVAPNSMGEFIQIGAFGDTQNVSNNLGVLTAMGMGAMVEGSGNVQVILAGPFSSADVRSALNHLRSAGYSDAFVR